MTMPWAIFLSSVVLSCGWCMAALISAEWED